MNKQQSTVVKALLILDCIPANGGTLLGAMTSTSPASARKLAAYNVPQHV